MKQRFFFMAGLLAVLTSCHAAGHGRVFSPDHLQGREILWPKAALKKPVVIQTLETTPQQSFHLVRLKGAETPHTHETHDLAVSLLRGKALVHVWDQVIEMKPGDFLTIPRGMPHWVENNGRKAAEALVVFTPPYDGKDTKPAA
ncbi:MAG: hypothetical protein A2036_00215 [Omnitrophica bacterium GWA2_50_21]|nr:MAG: hypothetical protein A2036_00215 [Omnitrophica bacterium GWA2_50_21]